MAGEQSETSVDELSAQDLASRVVGWTDEDPFFGAAYIDRDEWRDTPLRYRYIHGGFLGTDTRFSIYVPPSSRYRGRLLQFLQGQTGGDEATTIGPGRFVSSLALPFDLGALLVESNQGHIGTDMSGVRGETSVACWRASATTARFAKVVAAALFGEAPHHSYIYGGSGGGVRSLKCIEETHGIWDGAAPFVIPHQSQGTFFSLQSNVTRVLGLEGITRLEDATDVGGSGRSFDDLTTEQARTLTELYRAGWPRRASLRGAQEGPMVWPWTAWMIEQSDPDYYRLFWTQKGYAGFDRAGDLEADRVRYQTTVTRVLSAAALSELPDCGGPQDEWGMGVTIRSWARRYPAKRPIAVELASSGPCPGKLTGAALQISTGAAAGRVLYVMGSYGSVVLAGGIGGVLFEDVAAGDQIDVNNERYLAYCHHYRHLAEPKFREWASLVCDGEPIHPQRPMIDRGFSAPYTFRPRCEKMIITQNLLDRGTWPTGATSYREHLDPRFAEENVRVYFIDNAQHYPGSLIAAGNDRVPVATTTQIDYDGCVESAVRSLIDWIEQGIEPPMQTRYTFTADQNIVLPPSAGARGGIQPTVEVRGNGSSGRVTIPAGELVSFAATVQAPPGAGSIVEAQWDFDGRGTYPFANETNGKATHLELAAEHTYKSHGTYFATLRVIAQRDGNPASPLYRVANLGRIRVVVE